MSSLYNLRWSSVELYTSLEGNLTTSDSSGGKVQVIPETFLLYKNPNLEGLISQSGPCLSSSSSCRHWPEKATQWFSVENPREQKPCVSLSLYSSKCLYIHMNVYESDFLVEFCVNLIVLQFFTPLYVVKMLSISRSHCCLEKRYFSFFVCFLFTTLSSQNLRWRIGCRTRKNWRFFWLDTWTPEKFRD